MSHKNTTFLRYIFVAGSLILFSLVIGVGFLDVAQAAPQEVPVWGSNVRANSDSTTYGQHEPHLAISRTNPQVVVAVAKDYRHLNSKEVWIYVSQDGGQTWPVEKQLQIPGLPPDVPNQSDPVVMARDDGRIYALCLGYDAAGEGHGLFISWSDDQGDSWQDVVAITHNETPGGLDDKEWLAIDNNPGSPYYHNMYVAWADPYNLGLLFSRSTDGGLTWTSYMDVIPGTGDFTEYAYPVVAGDGTVYLFYMDGWGYCADGWIRMVKSSDGGISFSSPYNVAATSQPCSPIHGSEGYDQWRFFSIITAAVDPNNPQKLWAAWTDDNNVTYGKTDVLFVRSTDGGATWSTKQRLSHDDPEMVVDHITPVFAIGADSRLHAFWLDRRDDPMNHLFHAYYSSSSDGGLSWEPDSRVSEDPFDLNIGFPPGSNNAAGDYWGLDTVGNIVMAAWNTTVEGNQDIFVSRGVFSSTVSLTGHVVDAQTTLPIEGAEVMLDTGVFTFTNASGVYSMTLDAGVYTVTASANGYYSQTISDVGVWIGLVVQDFALQPILPEPVTLTGVVSDADTTLPIAEAEVILDTEVFTITDASGAYTFILDPGVYTVTTQAEGYLSQTIKDVELVSDTVRLDFALQPLQPVSVTLSGQVSDAALGTPINGAQVSLESGGSTYTNSSGVYTLTLEAGVYTVTAQAVGYYSQTLAALELISGTVMQDFELVPQSCPAPTILQVEISLDGLNVAFSAQVSSTEAVTYLWDFGDGLTSTLPSPVHLYPAYGEYPVFLLIENLCGVDSWTGLVELNKILSLPLVHK